jgi:uncharacterized membrane protein (UPF0127 family)
MHGVVCRSLAVLAAVALLAGPACGDDAGGGSDAGRSGEPVTVGPMSLDDLRAASGDAPAVSAAGPGDAAGSAGSADRTPLPDTGEAAISITAADGSQEACCVLVASTEEQRQRGLMEVTDLGGYNGMLFVWDEDVDGGFWMRNTPTPLSIAWFDADGDFVSATDMAPCADDETDCPVYPPEGPYRFALEVFQGDLDAFGVGPGSRLSVGGACTGPSG